MEYILFQTSQKINSFVAMIYFQSFKFKIFKILD
jgi:hypothetical protein